MRCLKYWQRDTGYVISSQFWTLRSFKNYKIRTRMNVIEIEFTRSDNKKQRIGNAVFRINLWGEPNSRATRSNKQQRARVGKLKSREDYASPRAVPMGVPGNITSRIRGPVHSKASSKLEDLESTRMKRSRSRYRWLVGHFEGRRGIVRRLSQLPLLAGSFLDRRAEWRIANDPPPVSRLAVREVDGDAETRAAPRRREA